MTANKHFKRRAKALSRELGVPYQTALQTLKTRKQITVLEPRQQLRCAVDRGLPPGPRWGDAHIRLKAPSLRVQDCSLGPNGEFPLVQTVPIDFTWVLAEVDDYPAGAWQCDVGLWADGTDVQMAGGVDGLPRFFKAALGDMCVEVRVHEYTDSVATSSVLFRPKLAAPESLLEAVNMLGLGNIADELSCYDGRALCIYRTRVFGSSDPRTVEANARESEGRGYTIDVGYLQTGLSKADGHRLLALLDSLRLVYRTSPLTLAERQTFAVEN